MLAIDLSNCAFINLRISANGYALLCLCFFQPLHYSVYIPLRQYRSGFIILQVSLGLYPISRREITSYMRSGKTQERSLRGSAVTRLLCRIIHGVVIPPIVTKRASCFSFSGCSGHFKQQFITGFAYFCKRLVPVISVGMGKPSMVSSVGAISASLPPSRSAACFCVGSTNMKGTGLVVWAVKGSPVS